MISLDRIRREGQPTTADRKSSLRRECARIVRELDYALTDDDVVVICDLIRATERGMLHVAFIWIGMMLIATGLMDFGAVNSKIGCLIFALSFVPLGVRLVWKDCRMRNAIEPRLCCRSCLNLLQPLDLKKFREIHCCPFCSASDPLSGLPKTIRVRIVDREVARSDPQGAVLLRSDFFTRASRQGDGFLLARTYVIAQVAHVNAADETLCALAIKLAAQFITHGGSPRVLWVITNPWNEWAGVQAQSAIWVDDGLLTRGIQREWVDAIIRAKMPWPPVIVSSLESLPRPL